MNEMLRSILDMDKKSRLQAEEAREAKQKAFDELTSIRTSLIEKKLAEAHTAVAKFREKERTEAEKTSDALRQKNKQAHEKLSKTYTENSEKWIDEIYTQTLQ